MASHTEVPIDRPLDEIVARVIAIVLAEEKGNRTRTAARLGIGVRTLQRHLAGAALRPASASDRTPRRHQA